MKFILTYIKYNTKLKDQDIYCIKQVKKHL